MLLLLFLVKFTSGFQILVAVEVYVLSFHWQDHKMAKLYKTLNCMKLCEEFRTLIGKENVTGCVLRDKYVKHPSPAHSNPIAQQIH